VPAPHLCGEVAVAEATSTGTHTGDRPGPRGADAPTGRRVSLGYVQVLRFRDGKHASFNLMFDRLLMLEQLGLVAAPSARAYSG
jgi:ketosteroid isomerase-like protein